MFKLWYNIELSKTLRIYSMLPKLESKGFNTKILYLLLDFTLGDMYKISVVYLHNLLSIADRFLNIR